MKHTFRKQHFSSLCNGSLLLVLGATLLFGACADDDLVNEQPGKHTGTTVAFNVSDAQMEALAQAGAKDMTRGLSPQPLSSADLAPRKLEATGSNPHDFCLIESTVEGINPVKPAEGTRAEIIKTANLGIFSSIGYRAASSTAAANPSTALLWFHGEKTNPDGTLNHRYDWDWPVNVYGRFYAVYPEATPANKITLSPSNYAQVPYIDFEVNQDVKQQKDLMTACSGEVHYIHGNDPTSNLKFRHALAAVKFSIGSNLSPVTITKIELTNVKYKGRYRLPNQADGSDATWTSVDNATTTMVLDNININAAEMPNTMLAGALDPDPNNHNRLGCEKFTFLMIPQVMPAKTAANAIKAVIHYQDGATPKTITIPLTGEWKAGVTKEYKLSQKNSSWGYQLTLTDNSKTFDYQGNAWGSAQFQVKSYREGGGTQQPVPWKISKYEVWDYTLNGGIGGWIDCSTLKPVWLGDLTDHGNGGTAAEVCNTAVKAAPVTDQLAAYNQVLKDATPKGTAANPYNLANPGGNGALTHIEETANSYLISAPGHYCIPLVYGNGIKNNKYNRNAYHTDQTGTYILQDFKDHRDLNITSPLINVQNSTDKVMQVKIVWMDQPNLIRSSTFDFPSYSMTISNENGGSVAASVDFIKFEVTKNDIRNGNAVIAVQNEFGITMWSWHLWFDHADALDKIPVKNHDGVEYKFTRNTLGQVHTKYKATSYDQPRKARLTIEQQAGNGGIKASSPVVITQLPGTEEENFATLYQWGRKDAFPGTDTFYPSNGYSFEADNNGRQGRSYGYAILHPENLFTTSQRYGDGHADWCNMTYANTWAANNTKIDNVSDDPVTKTVYDPCPAGFHVPASKAFTGFTTTGATTTFPREFNIMGGWNKGFNFRTNVGASTVFFPAIQFRDRRGIDTSDFYHFWAAFPEDEDAGRTLFFIPSEGIAPLNEVTRGGCGMPVRPAADN